MVCRRLWLTARSASVESVDYLSVIITNLPVFVNNHADIELSIHNNLNVLGIMITGHVYRVDYNNYE